MSWKDIIFASILIAVVSVGVFYLISVVHDATKGEVDSTSVEVKIKVRDYIPILKTDSCGWKVHVIKYKDKEYIVNSKGGILEVTE